MNLVEEALGRLSSTLQRRLRMLWDEVEDGTLTRAEFVRVATNMVLASNARGYALGAATVRHLIEQEVGVAEVTKPSRAPHHLNEVRLATALETILATEALDTVMQLERLGDNEPKQAAADGSGDVVRRSRWVEGWVRSLDSEACELCVWWWREGRVWRTNHIMPRHTGCTCTPTPVVKRTANYQTERQAAERRNERRRTA